jgi:mannose-6-phosphate isomerase-like protein (cupin superfamily)
MKIFNIENLPQTLAHNEIKRKQLVKPGDLRSMIQTVNYAWLEKGESFSPHKHDDCEELYFFLEGKGVMKINEKELAVKKDDFIVVEVGEWHSLKNPYSEKLVFLSIRVKI